jgi:hypothetical protein
MLVLRPPIRRWTAEERTARIAAAPSFSYPPPSDLELAALVEGYVRITGEPVRRGGQRNLIATGYRVHGLDYLTLLEETYRATGTTNLLGEVRCTPPRPNVQIQSETTASLRHALDCGCRLEALLLGLVYCADHRPPFNGDDRRRHDRRPSNPEAARFFGRPRLDDEGRHERSAP